VSLIHIKKWILNRQQDQLNSYFQSQEDAVILFTTQTKEDDSESQTDKTSR